MLWGANYVKVVGEERNSVQNEFFYFWDGIKKSLLGGERGATVSFLFGAPEKFSQPVLVSVFLSTLLYCYKYDIGLINSSPPARSLTIHPVPFLNIIN